MAQKYGIHYKVISDRGKDEKWVELRSQYRDKTLTKTLDKISTKQADKMGGAAGTVFEQNCYKNAGEKQKQSLDKS